jgi:hypothetical protein
MLPALIVLALGFSPTRALVLSQVLLSSGIPFALIPLVRSRPAAAGVSGRDRGHDCGSYEGRAPGDRRKGGHFSSLLRNATWNGVPGVIEGRRGRSSTRLTRNLWRIPHRGIGGCAGGGWLVVVVPVEVAEGAGSRLPIGTGSSLASGRLRSASAGRSRPVPVPSAPGAERLPLRARARPETRHAGHQWWGEPAEAVSGLAAWRPWPGGGRGLVVRNWRVPGVRRGERPGAVSIS